MDPHRDIQMGFKDVIGRSDDGSDRRLAFVTLRCGKNWQVHNSSPEVETRRYRFEEMCLSF